MQSQQSHFKLTLTGQEPICICLCVFAHLLSDCAKLCILWSEIQTKINLAHRSCNCY